MFPLVLAWVEALHLRAVARLLCRMRTRAEVV
jgi:hypothetical protein